MGDLPERRGEVTYADGVTSVLPGDRVSLRWFLLRRTGEVIYVPGISKRRGSYEHNGLTWVGVSLRNGWAIGTIVLPETNRLQSSVRFLGRGAESRTAAVARRRLDRVEKEEAARDAADAGSAATPVAPPKAVDWFAGAVAIVLQLSLLLLVLLAIGGAIWLLRRLF